MVLEKFILLFLLFSVMVAILEQISWMDLNARVDVNFARVAVNFQTVTVT